MGDLSRIVVHGERQGNAAFSLFFGSAEDFKFCAAREHLIKINHLGCVKAAQIQICKAAAAVEHGLHMHHVRGIEAAQIQTCQTVTECEHSRHSRHVRCIKAAQIQIEQNRCAMACQGCGAVLL